MRTCLFPRLISLTALASVGIVGCSSSPAQWSSVAPYAPNTQATAVGVNGEGASWFFQCDGQSVISGLRVPGLKDVEGTSRAVDITFDKEPTERSDWSVEKETLVLRGEPARVLSKRAALAYHAVVAVDGRPVHFALSGSHLAMHELMPVCPQLDIPW
jgi:hypothetical protein